MAGKGKGARGRKPGQAGRSGSERAGILFPTGRCTRYLRQKRLAERCSQLAGVFMAGALQYLVEELLDQAGEFCREAKQQRIRPRHIM